MLPGQGFLERYLTRPGPRVVLAAYRQPAAAPPSAQTTGPAVIPSIRVVATGASTGNAFRLEIIGASGAAGRLVAPDGLALQPTGTTVQVPPVSTGSMVVRDVTGFCAEFGKQPPAAGTVYRVADARIQQRLKPMRQIVRAADRLADAGRLHPDSPAADYLNATKQWAIWVRIGRWKEREFTDRFVERTKENIENVGQRWTGDLEREVRALLPNRWADVQAVLQASAVQ